MTKSAFGFVFSLLFILPAYAQDKVCDVLRAAVSEEGKQFVGPTAPIDRGRVQSLLAGGGAASYRAQAMKSLALTDEELADLSKNADGHVFENFEPKCDWAQDAPLHDFQPSLKTPGYTFTNPLFSSDGNLALVARSKFVGPLGSRGSLCVLRRSGDVWTATCFGS